MEKIKEIIQDFKEKRVLITANTGTGKTYNTINALKDNNIKAIVCLPNVATVKQIEKEYKIIGIYEKKSFKSAFYKNNIIVCTYNKLEHIIKYNLDVSEHILIRDEVHTTITDVEFKTKVIYNTKTILEKFKKVIDITATTSPLDLKSYDKTYKLGIKDTKKYNIKVILTDKARNKTFDLVKELKDKKIFLLNNNIKMNEQLKKMFPNESIALNAEKKENEVYKSLVEKNIIPENIKKVFTTNLFSAGLNIYNKEKFIIIINSVRCPALIKQFIARFRHLQELDIYLVLNKSEGAESKAINKERAYKTLKDKEKKLNEEIEKGFIKIKENGFIQDKYFVFEDNKLVLLDEIFLKKMYELENKRLDIEKILLREFEKDTLNIEIINENAIDKRTLPRESKEHLYNNSLSLIYDKDYQEFITDEKLDEFIESNFKEYDLKTLKEFKEYKEKTDNETAYELVKDKSLLDAVKFNYIYQGLRKKLNFVELDKIKAVKKIDYYERNKNKVIIKNNNLTSIEKKALNILFEVEETRKNNIRFSKIIKRKKIEIPKELIKNITKIFLCIPFL